MTDDRDPAVAPWLGLSAVVFGIGALYWAWEHEFGWVALFALGAALAGRGFAKTR